MKKQKFRKELRSRGFEPESDSDEDNPFAMYKYAEDEINTKNEKNNSNDMNCDVQHKDTKDVPQESEFISEKTVKSLKKLTVIDPGPSTSQSSTPWIDDKLPGNHLTSD